METLLRAGLSNALTATVLALLVACLSRPLARRPAILHGLWLLVLIKLVTPPIYEVAIPWPMAVSPADDPVACVAVLAIQEEDLVSADGEPFPDGPGGVASIAEDGARLAILHPPPMPALGPDRSGARSPIDWPRWTVSAWLGGTLVVLVVSGRRIRRFQRLIRSAKPATDEEREWVEALASGIGMRRAPELCWVRARVSPLVWPLGHPRLIIPRDLWKTLDGPQRSTLVVHELAHLKRGDHLVRFLELLVTALYWWHPLLWLIRQSLRDAEEQCCDAWVVWAFPDSARSYAETLLDTLDFVHRSSQAEPLLASGLGKVPHLRRRLTMIMTGTTFRVLGVRGTLGLLALAGVLLPVGATWAQQPQEPKEVKVRVIRNAVVDEPVEADVPVAVFQGSIDLQVDTPTPGAKVVEVRVDGQYDGPGELVITGSREDAIKELEAQIARLKKGAAPTKAGTDHIKALVRVRDDLKKAANPDGGSDAVTLRLRAVKEAKADQAAGDAAEIQKLKKEVARIRGTLETSVKELQAVQEKIRTLGGDPGEFPVVSWGRRLDKTRTMVKTYRYTTPTKVEAVNPVEKPQTRKVRDVQVMTIEPELAIETLKVEPQDVRVLQVEPSVVHELHKVHRADAKANDPDRLERLEKRLKALQEEVDGMKKGSK